MKITVSVTKARMKSVTRAIYTYRSFSYTYTLLLCWKKKVVLIAVFLSKLDHRPLFNVYIKRLF